MKESPEEEAPSTAVFVNTRRGKRDGTKRRMTAAATETGPQDNRGPKPAEVSHGMLARKRTSHPGFKRNIVFKFRRFEG